MASNNSNIVWVNSEAPSQIYGSIRSTQTYETLPTKVITTTRTTRPRRTFLFVGLGLFLLVAVALIVGLVVWSLNRPRSYSSITSGNCGDGYTNCQNYGSCLQQAGGVYKCNCLGTGYTGQFCDIEINECIGSNVCQNGGVCIDRLRRVDCDCTGTGFTGLRCDVVTTCSATTPCFNGGICKPSVTGNYCDCSQTGYTGPTCQIPNFCRPLNCLNGGTFSPSSCSCDCFGTGFTGQFCEIGTGCSIVLQCKNGGVFSQTTCGCDCSMTGFSGPTCELAAVSCGNYYCYHSGQCVNDNCDCTDTGYSGASCTIDINECQLGQHNCHLTPSPLYCTNNLGSFDCSCPPGYLLRSDGFTCYDVDECLPVNPCNNAGVCLNNPGSFNCDCTGTGYTGPTCNNVINPCGSIQCYNGGVCNSVTGTCDCSDTGFIGPTCLTDVDECTSGTANCFSLANCFNTIGSYYCNCPGQYYLEADGYTCTDVDECLPGNGNPCQNGGQCDNTPGSFSCDCTDTGYSGQYCQIEVNECFGVNQCDPIATCYNTPPGSYTCLCPQGYTTSGFICSNIDECADPPCKNLGTCQDNPGSFDCDCLGTGYSGPLCEQDINECSISTPCLNGGACVNNPGSFTCDCSNTAYSGTYCQTLVNPCFNKVCYNSAPCVDGQCDCGGTGYEGTSCDVEINECDRQLDLCEDGPHCFNTQGSYYCTCPGGYYLAADGYTCIDNDECVPNNPCLHGTCNNVPGSFECNCVDSGYDGEFCQNDINECADDTLNNCYSNDYCTNFAGGYDCSCPPGYGLDANGFTCNDDDECQPPAEPCLNNGACLNNAGSFACDCAGTGFTGDRCQTQVNICLDHLCQNGGQCIGEVTFYTCDCSTTGYTGTTCIIDINECTEPTHNCFGFPDAAYCQNTDGSFSCSCPSGFTLAGNAFTCIDDNECTDGTQRCFGFPNTDYCENIDGSFICSCPAVGWTLDADGFTCNDVDECANTPSICLNNGVCLNNQGSFSCQCQGTGYGGDLCDTDVNECITVHQCIGQEFCTNNEGSYTCSCPAGYELNADGFSCDDVDECQPVNSCQNNGACTNFGGSFSCNCANTGYQGTICDTDVNECTEGIHGCFDSSFCENTVGSRICTCPSGFTLDADGFTCNDDDECLQTPPICKNNGQCRNLNGGFLCDCADTGFSGTFCTDDIDECDSGTDGCINAQCINTFGSYNCVCFAGFEPDGNGETCSNINECAGFPCKNNGACTDNMGSFICDCLGTGYHGPTCELDINECSGGTFDCIGAIYCENTQGSYTCSCPPEFTLQADGFTCVPNP